jgi:hypothetical protein
VMELHRRVRRLKHHDAGIEVRISPAVQALALTSEAGQEARG